MEEIKAGRFAVCKHPDHTDETDCGNRAIGCSKHCLCCMGEELAIELPEIKHTPGPWSVGGEGKPVAETTVYVQVEDIVFTIAHCDLSYVYFPNKTNAKPLAHSANIANAQLIAAAPELLAALQHIMNVIPCGGFAQIHYKSSTWQQLDDAITKAIGDEQ